MSSSVFDRALKSDDGTPYQPLGSRYEVYGRERLRLLAELLLERLEYIILWIGPGLSSVAYGLRRWMYRDVGSERVEVEESRG